MLSFVSYIRGFSGFSSAYVLGFLFLAFPVHARPPIMPIGQLGLTAPTPTYEQPPIANIRYRRYKNSEADEAEALFDEGQYEFDSQDYQAAQRVFERLIDEHPKSEYALKAQRYLANIYRSKNVRPHRTDRLTTTTTLRRSLPPRSNPSKGSMRSERRHRLSRAPITSPLTIWPDTAMQRKLLLNVGDRVFFAADSERIGAKARVVLQRQADWLKSNMDLHIHIEGHSHDNGGRDADLVLSLRRAEEVRLRLIEEGVAAERISIMGRGRAAPVAICDTAMCAAQNRRVITLVYRPDNGTSMHRRASLPQPQR
ncbi:MAG: hypothetical protein CBC34_006440 [Hyphomicrobiaceae bacterium TMED74]|nr:hypothetical protein [Filomicrobium sp.]RPG43385.1 MAG: hypothetical protein CBC34_006440 [Hyphomicrobiaceae bacterium TMED74]